jgi:pyruvate/2-oxoglutarate dehydrogenase complex dihydrolipoamide dehydrogenase (E3) component
MSGGNFRTSDLPVSCVMPTDLSLARVGLSEDDAKRQDIPVRVAKLQMSRFPRTEATDEKQEWMKAIINASDDRLLGLTMIGGEAGEVLAAVQTAIATALPY